MNQADFDLLDRMANMEARLRALQAELERVVIDNHLLREENERVRRERPEPMRHPGYIIGDHWLQAAYTRVCTGEDIRQVMEDYGYYP